MDNEFTSQDRSKATKEFKSLVGKLPKGIDIKYAVNTSEINIGPININKLLGGTNYNHIATISWQDFGDETNASIVYSALESLKKSKNYKFTYPSHYLVVYSMAIINVSADKKSKKNIKEGFNMNIQYEAGAKAIAVFDKVYRRSPIGESVTKEDFPRWSNGGRMTLGYYSSALAEDASNYEQEAGTFLNDLNESYHIKGYHFNMTGDDHGYIYVAEDVEDSSYSVSSSVDEWDYIKESAYYNYLSNKADYNKRLKKIVQESLIITNENLDMDRTLYRLQAIQEGITDTVGDAWTKFKNFISKMWLKFTEFISRNLNSDKNYLNKYKDIILNKEFILEDVKVEGDYFTGMKRIGQFQIQSPNAAMLQDENKFPKSRENDGIKKVQKTIFPPYASAGNVEFVDFTKRWFMGGDGSQFVITKDKLNMTDVFNFCYNFEKTEKTLQRNSQIMQNAGKVFLDYAKTVENQQKQGTDSTASNNVSNTAQPTSNANDAAVKGNATNNTSANPSQSDFKAEPVPGNPKVKKVTTDGANVLILAAKENEVRNAYNAYKNAKPEEKAAKLKAYSATINAAKPPKEAPKQTVQNNSTTFTGIPLSELALIKEAIEFGSKSGDNNVSKSTYKPDANQLGNMNSSGVRQTNLTDADKGAANTEALSKQFTDQVNMYTEVSSNVFAGMLTAAQTMDKDFMKLIKAHVQSHLGNQGDNTMAQGNSNLGFDVSKVDWNTLETELNNAKKAGADQNTVNAALNRASSGTGTSEANNGAPNVQFTTVDQLETFIKNNKPAEQQKPQEQQNPQGQQ